MASKSFDHIIIFLVIVLFVYIFTISPSLTKAKATVTSHQINGSLMKIGVKVCPSFWFDDHSRENKELKTLFRQTVADFIQKIPATSKTPEAGWRVENIRLDSETLLKEEYKADGRCQDLTVELENIGQGVLEPDLTLGFIPRLFQDDRLLRVGVRDKQEFISSYNPKTKHWTGAAIEFAHRIAKKLGRQVRFVRLKSLDARFFALRYGAADLSISLISHTPEREEIAYLSDPYFDTGLVMGTFVPGNARDKRSSAQLNSKRHTIVAVQGSNGVEFVQRTLPKANLITTVTAAEIPSHVHELMTDNAREEIFFVTDELIARHWPESRLVLFDGRRLLNKHDSYVVAMENEALLIPVNEVIRNDDIATLYADHQP
ncbi:MAG: transporter substrate-binding domain-containing protein [Magnetococcales bacterium]|nr:transporter substrate-binding domain-containing protein [Magnetococcales bacterium]